jgi:Fe-S-cluster containining protein
MWYNAGLISPDSGFKRRTHYQFMMLPTKCETCGACCINKFDDKWIEVSNEDALHIDKKHLQYGDIFPFAMKQDEKGRCVCLDKDNRCTIYENRPQICRTVQMGDEICIKSLIAAKT